MRDFLQKFYTIVNKPTFLTLVFVALCLFFGSTYALKGSLFFTADISRDFLLFEEIADKKIVLIGPRASGLPGLFHGPLWMYLNFPAYILSQGNPVGVAWFWIGLTGVMLVSNFFLLRHLANKKAALIFTAILAGMMIPWMYQLLNPFGALALMIPLIWSVLQYEKTRKLWFWALTILFLGAMIQFQMAVGVPLTLLVLFRTGLYIYQRKLFKHLLILPLFLLPLSSFILFDLRHDFSQTKTVLSYISEGTEGPKIPWSRRLEQRLELITEKGLYVFADGPLSQLNVVAFALICMYAAGRFYPLPRQSKKTLNLLLYFFLGFYVTTLLFNGILLIHYTWPLATLVFGMVAILLAHMPRKVGVILLALILSSHLLRGLDFVHDSKKMIGKTEDDWVFQKNMAEAVVSGEEAELGFFIFTPDIYAYESKAAMNYVIKQHPEKQVARYQKKPVTYLILAPDPSFRPDILSSIWKEQRVRLDATPTAVFDFPEGYKVEKYELTPEQLAVQSDSTLDDWLHFR